MGINLYYLISFHILLLLLFMRNNTASASASTHDFLAERRLQEIVIKSVQSTRPNVAREHHQQQYYRRRRHPPAQPAIPNYVRWAERGTNWVLIHMCNGYIDEWIHEV
ncbi:OLC1v1014687C1 [Oldenlandia corymbosa var. corymbosa]|uniref:OLC1v1014687C1 n=1 Tax=Oldenlandia corymbosa var. corymbosa TaxID=529605 RepID=A0AAV1E1I5_OLDCO|nr:OLC1v1014687C1 [Oldenlandia corymbosa var. corymbosa]